MIENCFTETLSAGTISNTIASRKRDFEADLMFYDRVFLPVERDRLTELRKKLWAQELISLNALLERLCSDEVAEI